MTCTLPQATSFKLKGQALGLLRIHAWNLYSYECTGTHVESMLLPSTQVDAWNPCFYDHAGTRVESSTHSCCFECIDACPSSAGHHAVHSAYVPMSPMCFAP